MTVLVSTIIIVFFKNKWQWQIGVQKVQVNMCDLVTFNAIVSWHNITRETDHRQRLSV